LRTVTGLLTINRSVKKQSW